MDSYSLIISLLKNVQIQTRTCEDLLKKIGKGTRARMQNLKPITAPKPKDYFTFPGAHRASFAYKRVPMDNTSDYKDFNASPKTNCNRRCKRCRGPLDMDMSNNHRKSYWKNPDFKTNRSFVQKSSFIMPDPDIEDTDSESEPDTEPEPEKSKQRAWSKRAEKSKKAKELHFVKTQKKLQQQTQKKTQKQVSATNKPAKPQSDSVSNLLYYNDISKRKPYSLYNKNSSKKKWIISCARQRNYSLKPARVIYWSPLSSNADY